MAALLTLSRSTETYPHAVAHGASPAPDLLVGEANMSADAVPMPLWEQWWPATVSVFPLPFDTVPPDALQHDDFSPSYAIHYSPDWSGCSDTQGYLVPPSMSEPSYHEQSSSVSESRHGSISTLPEQPDKRKRKQTTSGHTTAKPTGSGSSRKSKPQATIEEQNSKGRKVQHAHADNMSSASPEQAEVEYSRRLQERNRVASNKFRVKKKEDVRKLKADEEDMERINRDLSSCVADLTLEVYELKIQLLKHTDCDCSLIRSYITNEAHRYIQDISDENQPGPVPVNALRDMYTATTRRLR